MRTTINAAWILLLLPFETNAFTPTVWDRLKRCQLPGCFKFDSSVASVSSSSTSTALPASRVDLEPRSDAKYPTQRGTTTDSRKIIATGAGRAHLTAVRLKHILFATEELAQASLHRLRAGDILFEELAQQLSACPETRDEGGEIGWVSAAERLLHDNDKDAGDTTVDNHLDLILPSRARRTVIQITTKPGDVISVQSERGFHLVQIVDVMADVRKMATRKSRSRKTLNNSTEVGLMEGLFSTQQQQQDPNESGLTYKIETMGCQMNLADSERIEGQLQSLGIRPHNESEADTSNGPANKQPDVVVLNTCSIRDHAEQKVYSYIGPYAKRKRNGENVAIIVAGCVAQQEGNRLLQRAPEVDLVMVSTVAP